MLNLFERLTLAIANCFKYDLKSGSTHFFVVVYFRI